MYTRPMFRRIKEIIPEVVVASTAGLTRSISSTAYGENFDITIQCSTGVIYLNPSTTASTSNGFRLEEADNIDLKIKGVLSVVGDSTTAGYQAIIWE